MKLRLLLCSPFLLPATLLLAQPYATQPLAQDKFRPLEELLPTPNAQRAASGAPGHAYWQQRADYVIDATLDDEHQTLSGREVITYHNASPDALTYLWVQLDANYFAPDADNHTTANVPGGTPGANPFGHYSYQNLKAALLMEKYDSQLQIREVKDAGGHDLPHAIVKTMMRVDLPKPLAAGAEYTFSIAWSYRINDAKLTSLRTGWEYFEKDRNYIYELGQWYPRMAAYTDVTGWQHKQYLGRGEFTLEFGDFLVRLTVPNDHIVSATGALQNPEEVLTTEQRKRLQQAATATDPVFIVTPEEAKRAEAGHPTGTKTWVFRAENVRDFAFASSRRFIWDAMAVPGLTHPPTPSRAGGIADRMHRPPVMAMSFYPNEGEPLWSKYATRIMAHTVKTYSEHTLPYPYPVVQAVNGGVGGMEYPMISFDGPRPEADGTYSKHMKYIFFFVIIHEVGHNFFPMIVNSDERRWGWMDEGMNTFVEFLTEQAWEKDYPSRRGEPRKIAGYMAGGNQVPIMTSPDSIDQLGNNAYGKTAVALNILRETIMGRALFDHAFKTYVQRWAFKRPYPADFFRTMEDASGMDLDWFWRGWFYTNDHVDISLDDVKLYTIDSRDPAVVNRRRQEAEAAQPQTMSQLRNASLPKWVEQHPEVRDFYDHFDETTVLPSERSAYESFLQDLAKAEIDPKLADTPLNFYLIDFSNRGGLVMPIILQVDYTDGTSEELRIPAEIWRINSRQVAKVIMTPKEIKSVTLDSHEETADTDVNNNFWPHRLIKEHFQLQYDKQTTNPMQELKDDPEAR